EAHAIVNVLHSLGLVPHFTFNTQWPLIADFFQSFDELAYVDLPPSQGDLFTPVDGDGWPVCVFDVNTANVGSKNFDGPEWIALVVEQHVGRVEIDFQVRTLELVEC